MNMERKNFTKLCPSCGGIIGNIKNLEFIPWEENVKKRTNCSINITELIN